MKPIKLWAVVVGDYGMVAYKASGVENFNLAVFEKRKDAEKEKRSLIKFCGKEIKFSIIPFYSKEGDHGRRQLGHLPKMLEHNTDQKRQRN